MQRRLQFKMFGSFRLIYDNKSYDLEEMLGKQLSSVFAYFIYNYKHVVSKDTLINIFWEDSDNPNSAIKFAIHRLRNKLKDIPFLDDCIITVKSGYAISSALDISVDAIELENLCSKGKTNNDLNLIEMGLEYYTASFMSNIDSSWVIVNRRYYHNVVIEQSEKLYYAYIENKEYAKAVMICENVLAFDECNEDIIFAYVNALINAKRYNDALKYYDYISKKYIMTYNEPLDEKISNLFALGNLPNEAPELSFDNVDGDIRGPLFCDSLSFKKMCEFEYRNYIRNKKNIYIIILEVKSNNNAKYLEVLDNIVAKTLRVNDAYARNGSNQIMIMVELENLNDEFVVTKRIVDRFYRRVDSKLCRINYYHKDISTAFK